jgi:hypothetical protein
MPNQPQTLKYNSLTHFISQIIRLFIDDISIEHTWATIEKDYNDHIHLNVTNTLGFDQNFDLVLSATNYTGTSLATEIQNELNTIQTNLLDPENKFTVTFDNFTQSLSIRMNEPQESFKLLTDNDLKQIGLNNLTSCNELLKNYGRSAAYTSGSTYCSGFLNLIPITTAFITSPNLGIFSTSDILGRRTIIKKVPIASDYGFSTIDRVVSAHDSLDCSRQTLSTMKFRITDFLGRDIPLHGSHVSFSLMLTSFEG